MTDSAPRSTPNELSVPASIEAEQALLGAVLIAPASYINVASYVREDDFFLLRHQHIWAAMSRLSDRREPIDLLTVSEELDAAKQLGVIGGAAYLAQLANSSPTSIHAEFYAQLVERAAVRRRLLKAADEMKAVATDEALDLDNVISKAETALYNVTDRQIRRDFMQMDEAVNQYFDRIEHLINNPHDQYGVPSGFQDLDQLLGGFQRTDLVIFAGRPGMGKTSFLLSAALNAARLNRTIAVFSMEMGSDQLVQRLISMETGINSQALRLGRLTQGEYQRFVEAAGRLSRLPIFFDQTSQLTPNELRTKCRRLQHEYGLDMVVIDYLQLMSAGGNFQNNRVQEISYISRALKELARELNVPLFSASQLSRAVESRQDKRPQLSDLRESGCLSGDAQVTLADGTTLPIRALAGRSGFAVRALDTGTRTFEQAAVSAAFCTGIKPVFRLTTADGRTIRATANHKFLTPEGWARLDALRPEMSLAVPVAAGAHAVEAAGFADAQRTPPVPITAAWDAVVSITAEGWTDVYDLTVPGHHNFVANGIVVHNSIEQDADVVMFLYRDSVYNRDTEFPNMADVIVAKHRNGRTDTVHLYFDSALTKFMDAAVKKVDLGDQR